MKLPDSRASHWLLTVASGAPQRAVLCPIPPVLVDAAIAGAAVQPGLGATAARARPPAWARCGAIRLHGQFLLDLYQPARRGRHARLAGAADDAAAAGLSLPVPCLALGLAHRLGAERAWWTLPALWTLGEWLRATHGDDRAFLGQISATARFRRPAGRLGASGWGVSGGGLGGF